LLELETDEKVEAMVLAMLAWDVRMAPATDMPGMEVQLHFPDMGCSFFHTTSEHAKRERPERKICPDVHLASHIMC
jgi:hypothetical protein